MQDTLEYIDSYFTQALSPEEKTDFETRCAQDEAFAREVAFYLTAREAAREALMQQKQHTFLADDDAVPVAAPVVKKMVLRKWLPYAAAACIILFVGSYFIFERESPQDLAAAYLQQSRQNLGQTMDASRDSLQQGIAAYKNGDFRQALALFEGVQQANPNSSDAKKYAGLTYLQLAEYDRALDRFQELAAMPGLYSNSGRFLQAVTLLQRNQPGDEAAAKRLLQEVVDNNLEGSKQAKEWLDQWD